MKLIFSFCFLCFVSLFSSCIRSEKKTVTPQDTLDNKIVFVDSIIPGPNDISSLRTYLYFVRRLDTTDATSSLKAVEAFDKYFAHESDKVADSAFVVFRTFYDKLKLNLNIKHADDTTDFSHLINDGNSQPTAKLLE
jgi:hypothetical protein